tara:strand:- start:1563 stop:1853 length:291 start_codon:yes stop_codon:yes gene_type:complete
MVHASTPPSNGHAASGGGPGGSAGDRAACLDGGGDGVAIGSLDGDATSESGGGGGDDSGVDWLRITVSVGCGSVGDGGAFSVEDGCVGVPDAICSL